MAEKKKDIATPEYAMVNGKVVRFADAKISLMANGLTFAVTVFEGLRAYWNLKDEQLYLFRMAEHIKRLHFSMRAVELALPPTLYDFESQVIEILKANNLRKDAYIRVQAYIDDWGEMMSTGPVGTSVFCWHRPRVAAFQNGKHFVVSSWRRNAEDASPPRIKSTANYLNGRLAGLEALRSGAGGAIMLNRDGTVSEGPAGCIFIVRDGTLITPPVATGILESITRDTLITLALDNNIDVVERAIGRTELYLLDEGFYCGTAQEIVPILSVDNKAINDENPGVTTRKLQVLYDRVVRCQEPKHKDWTRAVF